MKELIRLEHVSKNYGRKKVLTDINLKICSGEFISIMGKSGCGKSTLLNILGFLDSFDTGNYYFKTAKVHQKTLGIQEKIRAKEIGFVFQSYYLLENLSVKDNIVMPIMYNSIKPNREFLDKVDKYMDAFRLKEISNVKAKYLSGGEKQRVAIVRAISKDPTIILADEPTGNLDPENSIIIYNELKKLTTEGKTVVVVTHNPDLFQNMDQKYIIKDGGIVDA